jgi:hypothetical protein
VVVAEGHGWFLRRYDQQRAVQFWAFIGALPSLTIHGFDEKVGAIVRKFFGQNLTVADRTLDHEGPPHWPLLVN